MSDNTLAVRFQAIVLNPSVTFIVRPSLSRDARHIWLLYISYTTTGETIRGDRDVELMQPIETIKSDLFVAVDELAVEAKKKILGWDIAPPDKTLHNLFDRSLYPAFLREIMWPNA